ncbi:MAG: metallophosphoesterase [Clostridia bacterium]|nr:metallophosphoesterase [Clostridia bacterium]
MRALVMSDSHGDEFSLRWILEECWKLVGPIDAYIHCGDGGREFARVENLIRARDEHALVFSVKGNNDFGMELPDMQEITLDGVKLFVTHGHHFQVKRTYTPIETEACRRGCAVALFGHTHQPWVEQRRVLLVNPGSLSGETLALLHINGGKASADIMHF